LYIVPCNLYIAPLEFQGLFRLIGTVACLTCSQLWPYQISWRNHTIGQVWGLKNQGLLNVLSFSFFQDRLITFCLGANAHSCDRFCVWEQRNGLICLLGQL
jgi:hypothetical protein